MKNLTSTSYHTIYTTGYEGRGIDEFLEYLNTHDIQRVVDVREIPLSRKKGFSKSVLREQLAVNGIEYVHIKALGSPSELRKKVYQDKDFDYFFEKYEEYLEVCSQELEELHKSIKEKLSCLLCFEKKPANCHRSAVARKVSAMNGAPLEIKHI